MGIWLAFAPFIVFAVVDRLVGAGEGLLAGAATSALLLLRDRIGGSRELKILEAGSVILFGGLALYVYGGGGELSIIGVRLCVDAGLLAIVLLSLAVRKPFTMQYARQQVPREVWDTPGFLRANDVISGVWALAFLVLVLADIVMLSVPELHRYGVIATVVALVGAVKFTGWYPARQKARAS